MAVPLSMSPAAPTADPPRIPGLDRHSARACLVLFLVTLWPFTHRYGGLSGDAGLYAVQALAKIHPNLAGDLFLENNSQDSYTLFPLFYAWCIHWLGLMGASLTLVIALKVWFFSAVWALTRQLFDRRSAFLSTAVLMVVVGSYGGFSVFSFSEDWLTARTLAEPMAISALWLYLRGCKLGALSMTIAAFFVHPLMALPALVLLLLLWLPLYLGAAGAVLCTAAMLSTAYLALRGVDLGDFSAMQADWLEIVRERSVFLFPEFWRPRDWTLNALPFISLALSTIVLRTSRIQKLSIAVALVGVTGLVIAFVAAAVGPVGLFLQGQAWRWVWITRLIALVLIAPTLLKVWEDEKFGPPCAVLMVSGWTFSPEYGVACLATAFIFWFSRNSLPTRASAYVRWGTIAVAGILLAWAATRSWLLVSASAQTSGIESAVVRNLRNVFGFGLIPMALAWSLTLWVDRLTSKALLASVSLLLVMCCLLVYPGAFRVHMRESGAEAVAQFSDWRRLIAPNDTVFVAPAHNSAAFPWFVLHRPSYLTVDQSAGVVFSRATALEVRRRSEVLTPLMDPDWKLLSGKHSSKPLTRDSLIAICADPKLRFVVATESLGFGSITHAADDDWKDWRLYDCRHVSGALPQT
jgi:hypothetical protein